MSLETILFMIVTFAICIGGFAYFLYLSSKQN